MTDVRNRMPLVRNLWEEVGEGNPLFAHSTLIDDLLASIGTERDRLDVPMLPATRAYIDLQFQFAMASAVAGTAAFCYANEYLALQEYGPIKDAVLRAFPQADVRFFDANAEADGRHTALAEKALLGYCRDSGDLLEARRAVEESLAARRCFYDDILVA